MSLQKNGVFLKRTLNKAAASMAGLLFLTGSLGSAAAAYDPYCPPPVYNEPCFDEPCRIDFCEMPSFVIYGDFLYWQVHPEGLEFARKDGFSASPFLDVTDRGKILAPSCQLEPGFRVGFLIDLGCCEWDFFAQYTWMRQKFGKSETDDFDPIEPPPQVLSLHALIWNRGIPGTANLTFAEGQWDSTLNVLDFGLGRTFAVNECFDFRPHFGFKATWQNLKYDIAYIWPEVVDQVVLTRRTDIHMKTDFDGVGLRGGFDAAWKFMPCVSLVGKMALSAVWSELETTRIDMFDGDINNPEVAVVRNLDIKADRCALIPVAELLFGLRYDTTLRGCYDVFAFVGWETQVWWDLNRFLYVSENDGTGDSFQFGPHGNLTFQGLTVRAGFGF